MPPDGWPQDRLFVAHSDRSAEVSGFPPPRSEAMGAARLPSLRAAGLPFVQVIAAEPVKGVR
ncbi:hypothetical protein GCM10023176_42640 [Micromonospora coerulea]|uniref:Uncharacterized protein n=1 Tax=Micromonospora coerulea TaxID=47856 RepID=A0ABP8SS73_9ACTN